MRAVGEALRALVERLRDEAEELRGLRLCTVCLQARAFASHQHQQEEAEERAKGASQDAACLAANDFYNTFEWDLMGQVYSFATAVLVTRPHAVFNAPITDNQEQKPANIGSRAAYYVSINQA